MPVASSRARPAPPAEGSAGVRDVILNASGVFLLALLAAATPARGNDTLAVLGAGGLELKTSEHIAMLSEDLHLSPGEVRVRYAFRNESTDDITTLVAFPLPDIDQGPIANIDLPAPDKPNFVNFRVTVDGQPVEPKLEERAIAENGTDVTATLTAAGLPVNANLPGWQEKLRALPENAWHGLIARKLLDYGDGKPKRSDDAGVLWSLRATFHWEQSFPAGRTIAIEHRYTPIVGAAMIYSGAELAEPYRKKYCLDDQGRAGALHLLKQAKAGAQDPDSAGIAAREVRYILTTGANWKGPIGRFHLTIDKVKPAAVLSLCLSGLAKTGPTTFELERTDFKPREDIGFVILGE